MRPKKGISNQPGKPDGKKMNMSPPTNENIKNI